MSRSWPRRPRLVAAVAVLATVGALVVIPSLASAASPPPNPTDTQIKSAQQQKDAVAKQVGVLSGQIVQVQSQLRQLQANEEQAEQKLALALQKLSTAQTAAAKAKANVVAAQRQVATAKANFVGYVQASYMNGDVAGTTGTLLTAADPSALLQQSTLQDYQATHQINAIGDMQRATVAQSNANAAARRAVKSQQQATNTATQAKQQAAQAVQAEKAQQATLESTLAANQTKLQSAQLHLATLNNQRATFIAYQKAQAILAAKRAAAKRARELAAQRAQAKAEAAAAARARARARAAAHHPTGGGSSGSGGGSGSGSGSGSGGSAPSPSGGSWTAARGENAVQRAEDWLGTPYAWAGGNASGPTYGVCAGDGAFNDCNIKGFDCSGLALYAWAPYESMDHYAAAQYSEVGSYHPSPGNFMKGDLLFWSSNGTQGGIHHVAIYAGNGMVIQAPESGELIKMTPWDQVDWGYFGATRPLT